MAGIKSPKVKTPAQMKMEMAVDRARGVLPKAERDANLERMLEGSAIKDRLYHATGQDFTSFDASKSSPESKLGEGIYMTPDTKYANFFANIRSKQGDNAQIMPVYTSLKNPYVIEGTQNIPLSGIDKGKLQSLGYDGILFRNDAGDVKEVVAFDSTQVKSAIGNQGTYDINEPDITKAHGGAVHMAGGGLKPKVAAPSVMKRSGISELAEYIKNREGSYGERRVQRAADEIPKLGELYSQDALRSAFSGDNARALMTLKPSEFENYATPLLTDLSKESKDNIANLQAIQSVGGFSDVPFFLVNKELAGSTGLPWVTGHEGRHRNRAMDAAGVQSGLVQFLPRAELREPFPRRSQEQYIEAIKKEMELSGNKIKPEKYYLQETDENTFQRPAIDLPDLYAQGGAVHMKDGGDPDEIVDQAVMDQIRLELANQPTLKPTTDINEQIANARRMADPARLSLDAGDAITSPEMYALNRDLFSVFNKPTYGSEIPQVDAQGKLIPTKVQQSYSQTPEGIQEMINKAYKATSRDHLGSVNPEGIKGVSDVLSTFGLGMAAIPVHGLRTGFHYLQQGNLKDAPSGKDYEELMQPKTQEGAEFLETLGEIPEKITGSTMGFGMHPNLWVTGMGTPSVAQMRAGLKLGAERAAPVIGKIDQAVRTGYESGAIPQPGLSIKDVTPRVLAPANEQGFYSATEAAALNLQRKSGSGQAFLNDLLKQENVRPDEINAMGLDEWLKGKKDVTAAEVQDYIAKNKIQLGETVYQDKPNFITFLKNKGLSPEDAESMFYKAENRDPAADQFLNEFLSLKKPKFGGYQLPGGENYREVVITLPAAVDTSGYKITGSGNSWFLRDADNNVLEAFGSKDQAESTMQRRAASKQPDAYRSSHWDDANPLAHLRMSDRVTDGKKTLLVDEVQSDWHQEGREKGYRKNDPLKKNADGTYTLTNPDGTVLNLPSTVNAQILREGLNAGLGVPDAPFKDDWYQLALKRAIKEAIDGGYDRVALPTGARVAERFDLSKQIDRIDYNKNDDGTYSMSAIKGGKEVFSKERLDENELSGLVGKDVAKKIVGDEGKAQYDADIADELGVGVVKSLTGLDLSVGGKGMKKYYDDIYPGYLKKFGKRYGSTVGKTTVDVDGVAEPLHYMEITPAMREAFKTGIHMKRGGKVSFANDIDAMRLELSKG